MKVLKFGGSSVADAQRIESVTGIIAEAAAQGRVAVVLSAMKGITDTLIDAARKAEEGAEGHKALLEKIRTRHFDAVRACSPPRTTPRPSRRSPSCAMSWRRSCTGWSSPRVLAPHDGPRDELRRTALLPPGRRLHADARHGGRAGGRAGDGRYRRRSAPRGWTSKRAMRGSRRDFPPSRASR